MNNKNTWLESPSHKKLFPFDPKNTVFAIEDIARSLALQCRFNGCLPVFYSVAEHSIRVYLHVEKALRELSFLSPTLKRKACLQALLHDAGEMITGDIIRPLKYSFPGIRKLEAAILEEIYLQHGATICNAAIAEYIAELVKMVDGKMCSTERRDIKRSPFPWSGGPHYPPYKDKIIPYSTWKKAEKVFLRLYKEIRDEG